MKTNYKGIARKVLIYIMFIHISILSFSATYYVSNAGNDTNSGLTIALPWKTLSKVNASLCVAGDQILFKRGDTWRGQLVLKSGTSSGYVNYGAYGTGAKPKILGSVTANSGWSDQGGNIWQNSNAEFTVDVGNLILNNEESCGVKVMSATPTLDVQGKFWYDFTNHRIRMYSMVNPAMFYSNIECALRNYVILFDNKSYVSIENFDVRYGASDAIKGVNCHHIIIRNCDVSYIGGADLLNNYASRWGNGVQLFGDVHDVTVEKCHISQCYDAGISPQGSTDGKTMYNIYMQNNIITNCEYNAEIWFKGTGSVMHDVYFENNTCIKAGQGWSHGYRPNGMSGRQLMVFTNTATVSKVYIRNNIFYEATQSLIYFANANDVSKFILDNNLLYQPSGHIGMINTTNYDSFATWKTVTGQELHSVGSDPLFVSDSDFHLQSSSPAINAGVDVGLTEDYEGNQIIGLPDIGAYEYGYTKADTEKPTITGFSITPLSTSQSVSITTFTAIDNIGVTGYLLTETSATPTSGSAVWSPSKPTTYSFSTIGTKTLYSWAKDAAGNVSVSLNASATISSPVASTFTFKGPSSGDINSTSANFTVTPNNPYSGTITLTPSGSGSSEIPAKVLTFFNSSTAQTFTITPSVAGSITITPTNSGTLTNPTNLIFTANAVVPEAPTSIVATPQNASALISFVAPADNGGSSITGYTVTSIPAGGTDTNAGSTLLSHFITGLANGTSYTFTVKATNSTGTSIASFPSNPVIPLSISSIEYKSICYGTNYNGWTTSGKYLRTLIAKSGGDSIVTTNLTVNPLPIITITSGITPVYLMSTGNIYTTQSGMSNYQWTVSSGGIITSGGGNSDNTVTVTWTTAGLQSVTVNYLNINGCAASVAANYPVTVVDNVYTQIIPLRKGNNLFSTYLIPNNSKVDVVMKALVSQNALSKVQDEIGNSYEYWGTYGGWINKIGSITETEGYSISVNFNCTLQFTGQMTVLPLAIPLKKGWNFISYPRTDIVNAMTLIQSLIDQNKLVKVQDELGNSIENLKKYGGWINNIGNFIPGKGYKVNVNNDVILNIEQSYPKSADMLVNTEQPVYFSSQVEGNGIDHMNINFIDLEHSGLAAGDEVAAFDGDICVGTLKITSDHVNSGNASLIASYVTNSVKQDGFNEGDPIQIYVWNHLTGEKSSAMFDIFDGQMSFEKNASVLLQFKTLSTAVENVVDRVKIDVFPNPSKGKITVCFSQIPVSGSRIEILDITGRKICSQLISETSEEFNLDQQPAGIYLVKSITGSYEIIQKLILNK